MAGIIAILIGCLGIMGSSVMADSKNMDQLTTVKLSELRSVHFEGQATLVAPSARCIVLGGIRIPVVEEQRMGSGEVITTRIFDEKGQRITLAQLKNYDRVQVVGYSSRIGFLFAESIQRIASKPGYKSGSSSEPQ